MISKSNKFIKYASIAAIAIVALAASLSSNNINLGKNILRGRASDTIHGTITFLRATGTHTVDTVNKRYYTSGSTTTGGTVYLRNASNIALGSNHVAKMCATMEKGSIEPEIVFTIGNSGNTEFGFQYVSSISAISDSSNSRTLTVSKSDDGSNWSNAGSLSITNAGGSNADVAGAKYIKLTYSGQYTVNIISFTINYYCSASGTPDVPGEKTLTGISVKTAPTKVEYEEGDTFDPTGLVITASYDDLSSEDITYSGNESDFSFSPSLSTAFTTSDESVTISYGGKTCNQSITVEESQQGLSGTYSGTYTSIQFTSNSEGVYIYGSERLYFTYKIEGTKITFTYSSGDNTSFGNYRLFAGGSSPKANSTGSVTGENTISVKTYNMFDTATTRTFTKA